MNVPLSSSYVYDGYSIEFTTLLSGAAVNPGGSTTFGFTSPDSPATLSGDSPNYPGNPIGITFVYAGGAPSAGSEPSGDMTTFEAVIPVPEPSSLALVGMGAALLLAARRHSVPK
jgi:hypothetical protein